MIFVISDHVFFFFVILPSSGGMFGDAFGSDQISFLRF